MTPRASTQKAHLEDALKSLDKARKVFIALGLPLSRISTMDDAIRAIQTTIEKKFHD